MSILASQSATLGTGRVSSQYQLVVCLVKPDEHANCDEPGHNHHSDGCQSEGIPSDEFDTLHTYLPESVHPAKMILESLHPFVKSQALA